MQHPCEGEHFIRFELIDRAALLVVHRLLGDAQDASQVFLPESGFYSLRFEQSHIRTT